MLTQESRVSIQLPEAQRPKVLIYLRKWRAPLDEDDNYVFAIAL